MPVDCRRVFMKEDFSSVLLSLSSLTSRKLSRHMTATVIRRRYELSATLPIGISGLLRALTRQLVRRSIDNLLLEFPGLRGHALTCSRHWLKRLRANVQSAAHSLYVRLAPMSSNELVDPSNGPSDTRSLAVAGPALTWPESVVTFDRNPRSSIAESAAQLGRGLTDVQGPPPSSFSHCPRN